MTNQFDNEGSPVNTSGVEPSGHCILVIPYTPKKKESRIVIPTTIKDKNDLLEDRAIVIEIGAEAWSDEKQPRCRVGDKIYIPYMAGRTLASDQTADGQLYRLINDRDVIAVIRKERADV